jgi:long-chain acyl-CoA synthetase
MLQPTRLFDLPAYQLEHYPKDDMLVCKEHGAWKKYSTAEVVNTILSLASGLLKMGISCHELTPESQDKIAIISNNRPEWVIADQACQQIGAVLVPIYPTVSALDLSFILKDAAVKLVFTSDKHLYDKVESVATGITSIRGIYTFNDVPGVHHWTELLKTAESKDAEIIHQIKNSIQPEHLATIIYTSGTTGIPKGVMLSHRNILSNVLSSYPCLPISEHSRALSFLPLNHVYERMITCLYIYAGVPVYYAESMDTIAENLREVQPTIFTTVPRLLEKVYEKIMNTGLQLSGIKKALFFWAVNLGKKYEINTPQGFFYRWQLSLANKIVFTKWREALGNRLDAIVIGSAPCQVRLLRIFTAAKINCLEGYGLTETSPVISVNRIEMEDRMFGTVGPLIGGIEVKIASDGEILCKGPNVMLGYYKRIDLTEEVMENGWLHTGDIGTMVDNKFLKITDRKKELMKTSGGKYIAPQPIENKLKESPYIEQLMVVGEGEKFVSALIVPAFVNLKNWCERNDIAFTTNEMTIRHPKVHELYQQVINRYNEFFSHVEQIKKFKLLPKEWTIEGEELTPTLKLKRKVILQKYRDIIADIYH